MGKYPSRAGKTHYTDPNTGKIVDVGSLGVRSHPGSLAAEFDKYHAATYEESAAAGKSEMQKAYDREMARAQAQLGYAASAGPGTGGQWDASRLALGRAGMSRQMEIADWYNRYQLKAKETYINREDMQAHQMAMQTERLNMMQQIAEMNQPSWWSGLTSILGMLGGMFSFGGVGGAFLGGIGGGSSGHDVSYTYPGVR